MCRVLVRQAARPHAPAADDAATPFSLQLGDLQGDIGHDCKLEDANLDFGNILNDYGSQLSITDDDLDLLAMFGQPMGTWVPPATAPSVASTSTIAPVAAPPHHATPAPQAYVSAPQPTYAPAPVAPLSQPAYVVPTASPAPQQRPQQPQQPLAPAPAPRASQPSPVVAPRPQAPAPAPAAPYAPVSSFEAPEAAFQQALLVAGAQRAAQEAKLASAHAPVHVGGRRNKTPAEIAAQVERTKKRRRESAQRSRTRRNVYMKTLEQENSSLRAQVSALRARLGLEPLAPSAASSVSYLEHADSACSDVEA